MKRLSDSSTGQTIASVTNVPEDMPLNINEIKFRLAIEHTSMPITITDIDGTIEYCNHAARASFPENKVGDLDPLFATPKMSSCDKQVVFDSLSQTGRWQFDKKENGRWFTTHVSLFESDVLNICNYLIIRDDITENREFQNELEYITSHDQLTRLPNRELMINYLNNKQYINEDYTTFLCFIDIDRFRLFNEIYGHEVGDKIIKLVAERLINKMKVNCFVARFGGDQFMCAIDHKSNHSFLRSLRLLKNCFREPFTIGDREIHTTASIGVARWDKEEMDAIKLLHSSDTAMIKAKQVSGMSHEFFSKELLASHNRTLQVELALRNANYDQEFSLFVQPIVNASTGNIEYCETLLRWKSLLIGDVSPAEFIPIAEKSHLLSSIGWWVIDKTAKLLRESKKYNPDLYASVNISSSQLYDFEHFKNNFLQILNRYQLAPQDIEIEITENLLLDTNFESKQRIEHLKSLGFRIAIDDFGTGYSSLRYLVDYEFDKIKIDKSFICDLNSNAKSQKVVRSIINVAKGLNVLITAEGIEDKWTYAHLKRLGCDFIQGYYFYKPMPARRFIDTLS